MTARLVLVGLFLLVPASKVHAQNAPQFVLDAIHAIEEMLAADDEASLAGFMAAAMVPDPGRDEAATLDALAAMREELRGFGDDLSAEPAPGGFRLILSGPGGDRVVRVEVDEPGISRLEIEETTGPARFEVTRASLPSLFEQLEREGLAGVVHVRLGGEVVFERAFGMANPELSIPNRLDTVFGTGSRPIDYTVAAILLLDQTGRLDLDDPIGDAHPGRPGRQAVDDHPPLPQRAVRPAGLLRNRRRLGPGPGVDRS